MLDKVTRVYIQHPTRDDNMIPAMVVAQDDQKVRIRFLQPVAIPSRQPLKLYFQHPTIGFSQVSCHLQRMLSSGEQPEGLIMLVGEPERKEGRHEFRIGIHDGQVTIKVAGKHEGEVVNISCSGIAAVLDTDELTPEDWVDVELVHDCQPIPGRMQLRNWSRMRDGRIRFGFLADPNNAQLLAELNRLTTDIEKLKARRASGRSKRGGLASTASAGQEDDLAQDHAPRKEGTSKARSDREDSEEKNEGKRQHDRKPWAGMAKVYLRENQNLRVLDVNTIDLSPGGISFSSSAYIYRDSELLFEKPVPGGLFRIRAVVRSVHVSGEGKHRVGIQFRGAPLKPNETSPELESLAA